MLTKGAYATLVSPSAPAVPRIPASYSCPESPGGGSGSGPGGGSGSGPGGGGGSGFGSGGGGGGNSGSGACAGGTEMYCYPTPAVPCQRPDGSWTTCAGYVCRCR